MKRTLIWIVALAAVVVGLEALPESWCFDDPRVCEAD